MEHAADWSGLSGIGMVRSQAAVGEAMFSEIRYAITSGNTAQFVGSVGDAFSAICCLQIFRFTSSKPSKSAIASDEKFIRLRTNSFVRYCPH